MSNDANFKRLKYGIGLIPNTTTLTATPGDIDYDTTSGQFNFYQSSGVVNFATASGSQTFTNKTIPVGSNHITGTFGRAAQFNASTGDLEASVVTSTELTFVSGTTSNIQTQLNGKQSSLIFSNSLVNSAGTVTLVNDSASPGASKYYGTNGSSVLGYYSLGAGTGTVTSVALTVPSFLSISGSPITNSGTLAVSLSGTALPILNGGTGQTTANTALNALLPSQTSQSGNFLTTNGTNTSWVAGGSTATGAFISCSVGQSVSANAIIKFDVVNDDTNSAYSTGTGLYTAPSAGRYLVSAIVGGGGSNTSIYVKKNGTRFPGASNSIVELNASVTTGCGVIVMNLALNDTVGIYSVGAITASGSDSMFSIYKVGT